MVQLEVDELMLEVYNQYLAAQVYVSLTGELSRGKVLKRKRDIDENPTCVRHYNSVIDTR